MPEPETVVRVSDDPALLASVRSIAQDQARKRESLTNEPVEEDPRFDPSTPEGRDEVLARLDDPDAGVARKALYTATSRSGIPGAAGRIATRLEAGTAPNPSEWGLELLGIAETSEQVQTAIRFAFPHRTEFGHNSFSLNSTLRRTLIHPDPEVREPARQALLADCLRFPAERNQQSLASILSAVADESTMPVLEEMVTHGTDPFVRSSALSAIARLRPAEAVDHILADAVREKRWTNHAEMLLKYATAADAHRVLAILGPVSLEQSDYEIEHLIRLCLTRFDEAGRDAVRAWLPKLTARTRAVAVWGLDHIDLRMALHELTAAGVLTLPVEEMYEAVRTLQQHEEGEFNPTHPGSIRHAFYHAGILVSFDAESDQVPSPHDELVMQFGRHSRGKFAPECAIQIPGEEEEDELDDEDVLDEEMEGDDFDPEGPLRVQFIHTGRVYEFDPENFGDWYDTAAVMTAANRAVADSGRPERFIGMDTGGQACEYVFADPARFLPVARRLGLPVRP